MQAFSFPLKLRAFFFREAQQLTFRKAQNRPIQLQSAQNRHNPLKSQCLHPLSSSDLSLCLLIASRLAAPGVHLKVGCPSPSSDSTRPFSRSSTSFEVVDVTSLLDHTELVGPHVVRHRRGHRRRHLRPHRPRGPRLCSPSSATPNSPWRSL
jgi:hypothetical protein